MRYVSSYVGYFMAYTQLYRPHRERQDDDDNDDHDHVDVVRLRPWTEATKEPIWDFKFSRRRVWSSELSSGMYCRVK
jgi:hypothetical protein